MKFVYKPEGVEPREWDFSPEKLMSPEAEAIERLTGMTFGEWAEAVRKGSITALHGLLYVMLKRQSPTMKYDEVQFNLSELDFVLDDRETADAIAGLEVKQADGVLTDSEADLLVSLRSQQDASGESGDPKGD